MKKIILLIVFCLSCIQTIAPSMVVKDYDTEMIKLYNYNELKRYEEEFDKFVNQLGFDESRNDWTIINRIGAMGEFQFMTKTLHSLGYTHITVKKFKEDPSIFSPTMQRRALEQLLKHNSVVMSDFIEYYEGKYVHGVLITKAGILAGCHLGGPKSVKLFLASNGRVNKRDVLGTSVGKYIERYSTFDLTLKLK